MPLRARPTCYQTDAVGQAEQQHGTDGVTPPPRTEQPVAGESSRAARLGRRGFLVLAAGGAGAFLLERGGRGSAAALPALGSFNSATVSGGVQRFKTHPQMLAPQVTIDKPVRSRLSGLVITECHAGPPQQGPLIIDQSGQIVWFQPLSPHPVIGARAFNVRMQHYQGKPVLAWFEGSVVDGHGRGHYVICDTSYRVVARVHARRGLQGDLHEFVLTPEGTALFTCYGRAQGRVRVGRTLVSVPYWYGVVQEVDLATGKLLLHWRSDRHVALSESYVPPSVRQGPAWDYFHINSITIDPSDRNLVVSGRNTWAAYKLDRKTGKVIWRLGGKHSDFELGAGVHFAFQHDVNMHRREVMTVFDNEGGPPQEASQSRALVLVVDQAHRRVRLRRAYEHLPPVYSDALGSVQPLGGGRMFVGWGRATYFTQYGPHGGVEFDGHLTPGVSSYRAFLQRWSATPARPPDVALTRSGSTATLYVSWNGATDLGSWSVLGGPSADALSPIGSAPVAGFETGITVPSAPAWLAVRAYSRTGQALAQSKPLA